MQFSGFSAVVALSLTGSTIASPFLARDFTAGLQTRQLATCRTKVMAEQSACVKGIPTTSDGTVDTQSIQDCTSTALKGFNTCVGARKRDDASLDACADAVIEKEAVCLEAAGTDQKKVSKCSGDAYRGFVACV
ncbi:hypothetical protein ONS95_013814 [Cadophora gregata]|uniref:uncharacterized protein n=1 Tax=Cadophora gregata TaxID=51156 RepID=UPI0026DC90EB|nr:uncharacterized protein ONS95_013814 [Cadophora gregata]KAK0113564.1 hypothetical protein ONS96_014422 [Cadophora gregata f. sp. sojae]KAK0114320.1 hypothetical protein ONS95_013814 [Cadophora gregata]